MVIAVELAHELQPWMLGIVEPSGRYKVESDYKSWFGDMRVGDDVVDVVKLEPICRFPGVLRQIECSPCLWRTSG